jgi:hypothetical protein
MNNVEQNHTSNNKHLGAAKYLFKFAVCFDMEEINEKDCEKIHANPDSGTGLKT